VSGPSALVADVRLRAVYDSRGNPTVEAEVRASDGSRGRVASPSGASTGTHEVLAFPPRGVPEALERFRSKVRERLRGHPLGHQDSWDRLLREIDGTPNLSSLGGNTCTALSLAYAEAGAHSQGVPLWRYIPGSDGTPGELPALVGNVLNGGVHAIGGPDIQEFLAYVEGPTPSARIEAAAAVHRNVGRRLRERFPRTALGRGDEGGWVAPLGNVEALELLVSACQEVGDARRDAGVRVRPGLDLAASEFYHEGRYRYKDQTLDAHGQLGFVSHLVEKYHLAYVEDPFDQEDFSSFATLTSLVDVTHTLVVGDDLYTTNPERVQKGISLRATNAVLIKVNQVGTLTDTLLTAEHARRAGWATVTSHRSGETPDAWLPHLAVALASRGLKCGILGGERIAKLNELVRLAESPEPRNDGG